MAKMIEVLIFAYAAHGKGLSGGDRIFIEFARRWSKKIKVRIFVNNEGREMCRRQGLASDSHLKYEAFDSRKWRKWFAVSYFAWVFYSIYKAITLKVRNEKELIIYSASEFWMDSLPGFILKLRYPKAKWVAAWYQTAPNPLRGYAEGKRADRYNFKAFLYWAMQLPIKPIIANFTDFVLVNNEEERKQFPLLNKKKCLIVVLGAIDLEKINKWRESHGKIDKIYDAVFQGRFHPQKGVVELIEIWRKVVDEIPGAKLAMIGDGPLMNDVKSKIKKYKLEKNIKLFGYVFDGDSKYRTFSQSKLVVHPALYDSGGMASAEAMAFGLPAVGFRLKAYESYYPKGMVKVKIGDLKSFAKAILKLLEGDKKREKLASDAISMLSKSWSWEERSTHVLSSITQDE